MSKYLIFVTLLLVTRLLLSQEITVMTYNIKYDNVKDTVNNWSDRKEAMVGLIQHYKPQIFGTQEALHHQVVYLDSSLSSYSYVGVGRDDGLEKGEYAAIYFDRTRLKVLDTNTFWLSDTPKKVSIGWDAAMERICTYALFQDKVTGEKFHVFNAHFDHIGETARAKSAKLIVNQIKAINVQKLPVIVMGDFNITPDEAPIGFLSKQLTDGQQMSKKVPYGPSGTFSGFDWNTPLDKRIDYIFL